jgi:hypothetical protein
MTIKKPQLSQTVYAAPSPIHGKGLFARRVILRGEQIGTYEGPTASRNGTYVLWVYGDEGAPVGRSGRNLLRFLNHARPGNAEFDGYDLFARRMIRAGEEIIFDYGEEWPDE